MMEQVAKLMVGAGLALAVVGGVLWGLSAAFPGLRFGRLPGDVAVERGNMAFYFPVMTMVLVSVGLTLVLWLIGMVRR